MSAVIKKIIPLSTTCARLPCGNVIKLRQVIVPVTSYSTQVDVTKKVTFYNRTPHLNTPKMEPAKIPKTELPTTKPEPSTPTYPIQVYRRKLPDTCISFNSAEGKEIFRDALLSGHMECYFGLASQFRTQDEPAYCGVSTIVMVLNTLAVDPGRVWKGIWRWYHEDMMDCCVPLELVKTKGINLEQFACLASCNALDVTITRPNQTTLEDFRDTIKRLSAQEHEIMVASYSRAVLGQTGTGHFSPIGGYDPTRDLMLVMDTARFKHPPHWVPVPLIWEAMQAIDPDTGKSRGLIVLKKTGLLPLVLFKLSEDWTVDMKFQQNEPIRQFLQRWYSWLEEKSSAEEDLLERSIDVFFSVLPQVQSDSSKFECILTTQVDAKCTVSLSAEHKCILGEMLEGLSNTEVFKAVGGRQQNYTKITGGSLSSQTKLCRKDASKICEKKAVITPQHFVSMLLLVWPYTHYESGTNGASLANLVKKQRKSMPIVLQNEMSHLHNQLQNVLGHVTYYKPDCKVEKCCKMDGCKSQTEPRC